MMMDEAAFKRNKRLIIILSIITLFGGFLYFKFTQYLTLALQTQIQIDENNEFTKNWQQPNIPIDINVYVFGIQNPEEFARGAKAQLREYGPYSYNLKIEKDIISFSSDRKMVQFYDIQSFYFKPKESKGQLRDRVRVFNFPIYAMASMVHYMISTLPFNFGMNPIVFGLLNLFFLAHGESMIKTLTVGQLLNGYRFEILDTMDQLAKPLALFGIKLPDTGMPDNKFGFLWTKNFTRNGPYQTYTGRDGTNVLEIVTFKGQNSLNFYDTSDCNAINGSEGSVLGVNVERNKKYSIFNHDLCRSVQLEYQEDTWVNGLKTYRFGPPQHLFSGPSKNPFNRCYCTTLGNEDLCDGIFDLTRCLKAPLAYSFPHFLHANTIIRNNVGNMQPILEKHRSYADFEPFLGGPLNGVDRIQINVLLHSVPYLGDFSNVRKTILPLVWIEKKARIDDKLTLQLQMALYPIYTIYCLIYLLFFGGSTGLLIQVGKFGYNLIKNTKIIDVTTNSRSNSEETLYNPKTASLESNEKK